MATGKVVDVRPQAGNPHVVPSQCNDGTGRFDEGKSRRRQRRGGLYAHAILLVGVVTTFLFCASAADEKVLVYWNPNGSGNWASSTRWKDANENPIVPSGSYQLRLQGATWATDEDKAVLEGAAEIVIPQAHSVFTISNDVDMTLTMLIYGEGSIAKYGKGELLFSMGAIEKQVHSSGSVEAYDGVVRTSANGKQEFGTWIGVHAPGVFAFAPSGTVSVQGLVGDGVVSNTSASTELKLYFEATEAQRTSRDPFEFAGSFAGGKICYYGYPSHQRFTNAAMLRERFYGYQYGGYLGTAAFPSNVVVRESSELEYLGMGETTGTGDHWLNNNTAYWKMNGGPHGGLNLARTLKCNPIKTGVTDCMMLVEWTGDHTTACSFTGTLTESGSNRATYFKKTGTGTWRFSGSRPNRGTVATEKGTLEYDSIETAGTSCSLGQASILHDEYTGERNDKRAVPYAYLLGDGTNTVDEHTGTMAYIGTTEAVISNRPVAVKGAGRFASSTAALEWTGFTSVQAGDNTLVLAGGAADCVAWGVTNGSVGTLSVVKEGTGDWTLGANWNISGKVMAHGGKLTLATRRYTFYRLSLMENYRGLYSDDFTGKDPNKVWLAQLALVDGEGANQITNLTYNSAANGQVWKLKPGEAALSTASFSFLGDKGQYLLGNLFQDSDDSAFCGQTNAGYPQLTNTNTWVRVVMRLPEASHKDISGYDFKMRGYQSAGSLHIRDPRSWMIEGSVDGRNWHELTTVISNTVDTTVEDYRWLSNNSRTRDPSRPFATLNSLNDLPRPAALEAVGVTGGATLVSEDAIAASGIVCDAAAGGGTLKGFAFTPNAELRVENLDLSNPDVVFVPVDLSGCTGWENTAGWTLSINGGGARARRFRVTAAGVRIMPKGTMLIFR